MKHIITAILCFCSLATIGQNTTYDQWKEEAKNNIRLLPEYGHVPKTDAQKQADKEFIEDAIKQNGTPHNASEHLVELGFKYFNRGDIKTAMYRFNQAWLLDPNNENIYWGFGAVYFNFKDYEAAIKSYDQGLGINPKSSNILTDKATIYMAMLNDKFDQNVLNKAIDLFDKSYSIDPTNQNTSFKLSTLYFSINDCGKAMKYYNECKTNGGQPITQEYTDALLQKCK